MNTMTNTDQTQFEEWRQNPKNWKWGIFYYNREDKRIFPPKRCKAMGWTINFGNPASIAAFTILLIGLIYFFRWISS
ncbi:MAG: DUF5808 domain-containing protein [Pyrinomonadaceae bacterium]